MIINKARARASNLTLHAMRAPFLRSVSVIAGGSAIAQAIPVVLTPVLTRLYSPSDMGVLGLYLAFITFAAGSMSLGYSQAIVSAKDDFEAAQLVVLASVLVIPVSTLASVVLWTLIRGNWLGYGALPGGTVIAMLASLILTEVFFILRYWLVRTGSYREISVATVGQSVGRIGTQLALGLAQLSWKGLIGGEIIGRIFGLRGMWAAARTEIVRCASPLNHKRLLDIASSYRKFPMFSTPATLLDSLGPTIMVPLIATNFGLMAAGQYSVANRILLLPMSLIGSSVADVFHNTIARRARENPDSARRLFFSVALGLLAAAVAPMSVVAIYGETLWPLILGEQWQTAGSIAAVLAPRALTQFVVSPLSRVVLVYQGQELKLMYNSLTLASVIIVYILAANFDWSLLQTLTRLAWWQVCLHAVYFSMLTFIVRRGLPTASEPVERG